jgi:hypothetical protein
MIPANVVKTAQRRNGTMAQGQKGFGMLFHRCAVVPLRRCAFYITFVLPI